MLISTLMFYCANEITKRVVNRHIFITYSLPRPDQTNEFLEVLYNIFNLQFTEKSYLTGNVS